MSRNSDARKMIDLAESVGLEVVKVKHGGYAVVAADSSVVARIPGSGNGYPHWVQQARKAILGSA